MFFPRISAWAGCCLLLLSAATPGFSQAAAIAPAAVVSGFSLAVDLSDAPRHLLHSMELLPAAPGPLTLVYPKWLPGEHAPDGPIDNQAALIVTALPANIRIKWERDPVDMYSFHLTVPAGTTQLKINMDFLATAAASGFSAGASTTAQLAVLSWNSVLLYPAGTKPADLSVTPSVTLPSGWKFATALEPTNASTGSTASNGSPIAFAPVPLDQLIDSPVLTGRWFREIPLAAEGKIHHFLDIAADGPEDLDLSSGHIGEFSKLVRETGPLFRSRHYTSYRFLVALSDAVAHFGLEHHQSSDDQLYERSFTDDNLYIQQGSLLPHEFTHSWNGKYRRPAGLATADYQQPMKGNLLWVYEGLTEYFGDVLATRAGIWNNAIFRDRLANNLAQFDAARPGRTWRDLQDTATAAQILQDFGAASPYDNVRRDVDYYDEGELLWLEVDATIRQKSGGKKTLNDFAAAFYGVGGNTGPVVVTYTFEDIVAGLNSIVPNDWGAFLRTRLDANTPGLPELAGINALSGYKLVYTDKPDYWTQLAEYDGSLDARYSIGLQINSSGSLVDVIRGSEGDKVGLAPGFRIVAVNGRAYSQALMRAAIRSAQTFELIVENGGYFQTVKFTEHTPERYPTLERVQGTVDRLDDILEPMTK